MTWNLSVQDSLKMGKPAMVLDHPTHEYVLGPDYPYYFKTPEEFESMLENLPEKFDWKLPPHDEVFKKNFVDTLTDAVQNSPKKKVVRIPRKKQYNGYGTQCKTMDIRKIYCLIHILSYIYLTHGKRLGYGYCHMVQ